MNFALQLQLGTDHGDGCLRFLDAKSRATMTPLPLKPTALIRLREGLPVPDRSSRGADMDPFEKPLENRPR